MSDSGRTMRFLCKPCGHWYEEYLTELHVARAHGRIHELQQALASANSVAAGLRAELADRTAERDAISELGDGICRHLDKLRVELRECTAERDAARAWSHRWKALARKRDNECEEWCGLERHAARLSWIGTRAKQEHKET